MLKLITIKLLLDSLVESEKIEWRKELDKNIITFDFN